MSQDHAVRVVRLDALARHPGADALSITMIDGGFPCVVRTAEWAAGDLAVYIPVDSAVLVARPEFAFLAPRANASGLARIKALRLRGVFSMGLLIKPPPGAIEGDDVAEALGVTKWIEAWEAGSDGEDAPAPQGVTIPVYDLESLRRHGHLLIPGEAVVVTEKLHGSNGRAFIHPDSGTLHIGSHTRWKRNDGMSEWAVVAREDRLGERLRQLPPWHAIYWECIGRVGGFGYGQPRGRWTFRIFDVFDAKGGRWLDHPELVAACTAAELPTVPVLYEGPYDADRVAALAEGPSTLDPGHVREGVVVRPVRERYDSRHGRVVLKLHGQGFLLR